MIVPKQTILAELVRAAALPNEPSDDEVYAIAAASLGIPEETVREVAAEAKELNQ